VVGEIETATPPAAAIVTVAAADFVVSACETAVTVTVAGLGAVAGAVKRPEVEIVPWVESPPATPLTCQVIAVFVVPVTVPVNCSVAEGATVPVGGAIVTVITGFLIIGSCEEELEPQPEKAKITNNTGARNTKADLRNRAGCRIDVLNGLSDKSNYCVEINMKRSGGQGVPLVEDITKINTKLSSRVRAVK